MITTKEFSKLANVSVGTINYWARTKKINCIEFTNGYRYYNENDVNLFLKLKNKKYKHIDLSKFSSYSKDYMMAWRNNNKDKCREYSRNRYKKNIEFASIKWMRNFLYRTEKFGFNKTKMNTIMEFGYTPKQLIQRIECQFKDGMSWNNRNEWHIDHKKPISTFNVNTSPQTINMLSNLQPMWKRDNLSKSNKFC